MVETKDRVAKAEVERTKAEDQALLMNSKVDNSAVYKTVLVSLTKSNNLLKEAISYTEEIIREIKVAEE
jgi:hypothetical protein